MKIERQQVGTVRVLAPIGALVDHDAEGFCKVLHECVSQANPRVVVSLQEVPYLDSVAIEGLLDSADELAERAMSLKLVQVPPTCREAFELTGISARLSYFETVQDAVKSFL